MCRPKRILITFYSLIALAMLAIAGVTIIDELAEQRTLEPLERITIGMTPDEATATVGREPDEVSYSSTIYKEVAGGGVQFAGGDEACRHWQVARGRIGVSIHGGVVIEKYYARDMVRRSPILLDRLRRWLGVAPAPPPSFPRFKWVQLLLLQVS